MQEETTKTETKIEETVVQSTTPVTPAQTQSVSTGIQKKDLLIPVSIILAGLAVGVGLYFSGSSSASQANPKLADAPEQQEVQDNTQKVNPVTADDHIKGSTDAKFTVVEYSDFDCPFCSRFHDVMNAVYEKYDGEVAWVYRQSPIQQLHPQAPRLAVASECVAKLGGNAAFWTFADAYFEARGLGDGTAHDQLIPKLVTQAGVNQAAFAACAEDDSIVELVQEDMTNASVTGGGGTPWSILIGPSGKTYPINGALPQAAIEQLIEIARSEA